MGASCSCSSLDPCNVAASVLAEPSPGFVRGRLLGGAVQKDPRGSPEPAAATPGLDLHGQVPVNHQHNNLFLPSIHTNSPRPDGDMLSWSTTDATTARDVNVAVAAACRLEDAVRHGNERAESCAREAFDTLMSAVDKMKHAGNLLHVQDLKVEGTYEHERPCPTLLADVEVELRQTVEECGFELHPNGSAAGWVACSLKHLQHGCSVKFRWEEIRMLSLYLTWTCALEESLAGFDDEADRQHMALMTVEFLNCGIAPEDTPIWSLAKHFRTALLNVRPTAQSLGSFNTSVGLYLRLGVLPHLSEAFELINTVPAVLSTTEGHTCTCPHSHDGGPCVSHSHDSTCAHDSPVAAHWTLKQSYSKLLVHTLWDLIRCLSTCQLPEEVADHTSLRQITELCAIWIAITKDLIAYSQSAPGTADSSNFLQSMLLHSEGYLSSEQMVSQAVGLANIYKQRIYDEIRELRQSVDPSLIRKKKPLDNFLNSVMQWTEGFFFMHMDGSRPGGGFFLL